MTADARPVTGLTASLRICAALTSIAFAVSAQAAEFSARDIARLLFQTAPGSHPALDGKNLRRLDLSNLDFKKANLSKTDFFGADLSGADLSSTNLSGAIARPRHARRRAARRRQSRQRQHDAPFAVLDVESDPA